MVRRGVSLVPYGEIKDLIDQLKEKGVEVSFVRHTPGRFDYSDSKEVEANCDDVVYVEVNVQADYMKNIENESEQ